MHRDKSGKRSDGVYISCADHSLKRREFLSLCGTAAAGLLTQTCGKPEQTESSGTGIQRSTIAVRKTADYDRRTIRSLIQGMFDGIGGIDDIVKPGDKVTVLANRRLVIKPIKIERK